ncbi:MAG: ATP-binding cassette domain-containing protein [Chitinophagales bacterium]|nr:ATP-binding cassette domain-containing protein [Chitinophagales bacterium]
MLQAINLSKTYGKYHALKDLNLKVNSGEIFCLLGANGAGKTTTINLFLNFITPSSGKARINNISVSENPVETKKYVAYIPENLALYPELSGLENLTYFTGLANKTYHKDHLVSLLKRSGLQKDAFNKRVSEYSKGMRQKVGIAIALAKEAKALLLDEPTSGLDPKASNEFSDLLKTLSADGIAILMTTHDLFRAQVTGSHIGIMKEGRLLEKFSSKKVSLSELEKTYLNHMNTAL